jgi:hypothetical protein
MALKLYRTGTTHCINGIQCEIRLFKNRDASRFIGLDGWCSSIDDLNKPEVTDEWKGYTSEQIRDLAKDESIEGWDTKRINTLKELLSGQSIKG